MTTFLLPPGFRATDDDDNPLAGGQYRFYAAGTTTPKAVYSDAALTTSLGAVVNLNSGGEPVTGSNVQTTIYLNVGSYRVRLYNAAGVVILDQDGIPGADAPSDPITTAAPVRPVISKTSSYTVTADDRAAIINAICTGGTFPINLPSAVTMGDGFMLDIRHGGSANQVQVLSSGSQFVRGHQNLRSYVLTGRGETVCLVSDGSDWIVHGWSPPLWKADAPYFRVLDRLASPPTNPDAGARYLINGTPTGVWSTLGFAEHDIAEADGNGSWIKLSPESGWQAFDADEEISLVFRNDQWENFQVDPGTSTLKTLVVQDQKASGTVGGTPSTSAFTTSVLNTSVVNTISGASLAGNEITLPAGRYRVTARKVFYRTRASFIRFKTSDDSSVVITGEVVRVGPDDGGGGENDALVGATCHLTGEFEIAVPTEFVLQYWAEGAIGGTSGLGYPASAGVNEVYATVLIEDLSAQQGPKGDQGDNGEGGLDAAYWYQWNTSTTGDPGSGKIRTDHATPASVTSIAVSETDAAGGPMAAIIASWDDSTSDDKARIRFHKEGSTENFFEFLITGTGTDQGSYWTFPVSLIASNGTLGNGNDLAVLVLPTGDKGDPGITVPDIDGLTETSLADDEADFIIIEDASAGATRKLLGKNLGFTQAGTGALTRSLQSKLRDVIDARDFGVSTSASGADNKANFDKAIAHCQTLGRSRLILPHGQIDIAGEIAVTGHNVAIEGAGRQHTIINQKTMNAKTINMSGNNARCVGIGVNYDGTPTSGGDAFTFTGIHPVIDELESLLSHRAYVMTGAHGFEIGTIRSTAHVSMGVRWQNLIGGRFTKIKLNAGDYTNANDGNVVIMDLVEHIQGFGLEALKGRYGLIVDAASPGFASRAAYMKWKAWTFDDSAEGSIIKYLFDSDLDTVQFSGGRTASGYHGAQFIDCHKIRGKIVGHYSGLSGITTDAACSEFDVEIAASANSCMDPGNHPGASIDGNASKMKVHFTSGGNDLVEAPLSPLGAQSYDIIVTAGTGTQNELYANSAGGTDGIAQFGSTGTGCIFEVGGARYGGLIAALANDGASIGAAGNAFSDAFFASGAVINFGNGNVTLTHGTGQLTHSGTWYNIGNIYANASGAAVAGGTAAFHTFFGGPGVYSGSGAPTVSAPKGSLYLRTDGSGTGDRAYINTNGSTTWTALTTAA